MKRVCLSIAIGVLFLAIFGFTSQTIAQSPDQEIATLAMEQFNQHYATVIERNNSTSAEITYSDYKVDFVEIHDDWARIHIISKPSNYYDSLRNEYGIRFQGAVAQNIKGNWQIFFQGTTEFDSIKDMLPQWLNFLVNAPRATDNITQFTVPALPTVIGDSNFSTLRFTQGANGIHWPANSIDLAVLNKGVPTNNFPLSVYALDEGEIKEVLDTCFSIVRPDGLIVWYQHVLLNQTLKNGQYVRMNDLVGITTSQPGCGYTQTVSHHIHLSFYDASNGYLRSQSNAVSPVSSNFNDWQLINDTTFVRNGVQVIANYQIPLTNHSNWLFNKGCPDQGFLPSSTVARLFSGKNCTENPFDIFSFQTEKVDLSGTAWDNQAASLKVAKGYAIKLWLNAGDSNYACYDGDLWDMSKDYMPGTPTSFYKTVSAVQVVTGKCADIVDPFCTLDPNKIPIEGNSVQQVNASCQSAGSPPPDTTPPHIGPQSNSTVKIYAYANYEGTVLFSGSDGFSNEPNAGGYSLEIPNGWSVITYREDNGQGQSRCWNQSVPNLQDHEDWQNKIQSIQIYRDFNVCPTEDPTSDQGVVLYDYANYSTQFATFGTGFFDRIEPRAESIRIPTGWSIFLYEWDKRQVRAQCFNRNIPDLTWTGDWKNKAYGIEIYSDDLCQDDIADTHDYVLYNQEGFEGGDNCGGNGPASSPNLSDWCGGDWNDRVSSIRIKRGWSVRVWEHSDYSGGSVCFSHGYTTMRNNAFDNGTSIAIYPPEGDRDSRITSFAVFHNEYCDGSPTEPGQAMAYHLNNGRLAMGQFILQAEDNNAQSIKVEWELSPDSSTQGYHIYEHLDNDQYVFLAELDSATTSWTHENLPCGEDYNFLVKAYNQWGESHSPSLISASTPSCFAELHHKVFLPLILR